MRPSTGIAAVAVAAALLAALTRATAVDFPVEIVNGTVTADYPSVGALLVGDDPASASSWCSGVLIGCKTFLTAAHCVCSGEGADCQGRHAPSPRSRLVFLTGAGFFEPWTIAVHPAYRFPTADLAVITLSAPVTAVAPAPLADGVPAPGMSGTIAGFGRTSGGAGDYGLKRMGRVTTTACPSGISATEHVCWLYERSGASSCNADSGGPLFLNFGAGPSVAGIISGGIDPACAPGDINYTTDVHRYAEWIRSIAGVDLDRRACGTTDLAVIGETGALDETIPTPTYVIDVPADTNELRIALNGTDDGETNFDLGVRAEASSTTDRFDCHADGSSQYAYCALLRPTAGRWLASIERRAGVGRYQLTATLVGGPPPVCGNALAESGEDCDGTDDLACPGACEPSCQCAAYCADGSVMTVRGQIGPRFLLKAVLDDRPDTMPDPRQADFALRFVDGGAPVDIAIPADDRRWTEAHTAHGVYEWSGRVAGHRVVLRYRRLTNGRWLVTVKGRAAASRSGDGAE